eukprot:4119957-Pyramimonas_sp.AAC.1
MSARDICIFNVGVHYNEAKHYQVKSTVSVQSEYSQSTVRACTTTRRSTASNGKGAHTAPQKGLTFSVVDA